MRTYEVVIIAQADLDENAFNALIEKVSGWITTAGGTVAKVDRWGKRHMAYRIRKQSEGQYVVFTVQMAPTYSVELERNMRLQETIMRFMVTLVAE
jgi:small subunit ribosomal protein S6